MAIFFPFLISSAFVLKEKKKAITALFSRFVIIAAISALFGSAQPSSPWFIFRIRFVLPFDSCSLNKSTRIVCSIVRRKGKKREASMEGRM